MHCVPPESAFDETQEVRDTFPGNEERTLDVTCEARNRVLRLALRWLLRGSLSPDQLGSDFQIPIH